MRTSRIPAVTGALLVLGLIAAAAAERPDAGPASGASPQGWLSAQADYHWSFPADHWAHRGYRSEWWYFTGHLEDADTPSRRFGYQFTFFRIGLLPEAPELDSAWAARDLIMGHASISDLDKGEHVFSELLYRAIPLTGGFGGEGDSLIAWSLAPAGSEGRWTLSWNGQAFDFSMRDDTKQMAFSLSTRPLKPLIFQGPNGFSPKGESPGSASQYYSFTRLETEGWLEREGRRCSVAGQTWMDKEFGSNQLGREQVGWDWFSLQLEDGRELMLYHLRDVGGAVDFARGTLIELDGTPRYLEMNDWKLESTEYWTSPESEARYPVRWRLSLPAAGLDLELRALMQAQENVSRLTRGVNYWEGAIAITAFGGAHSRSAEGSGESGRGYVELTGYGEGSRPPI